MRGEVSRESYIDRYNRMQVVIETNDGKTHVLNFPNYHQEGHSHIIYRNGVKDYDGSFNNRECYEHSYNGLMFDYYNATEVSSFPYTFEQIYDALVNSLSREQLTELKEYLSNLSTEETYSKTR